MNPFASILAISTLLFAAATASAAPVADLSPRERTVLDAALQASAKFEVSAPQGVARGQMGPNLSRLALTVTRLGPRAGLLVSEARYRLSEVTFDPQSERVVSGLTFKLEQRAGRDRAPQLITFRASKNGWIDTAPIDNR